MEGWLGVHSCLLRALSALAEQSAQGPDRTETFADTEALRRAEATSSRRTPRLPRNTCGMRSGTSWSTLPPTPVHSDQHVAYIIPYLADSAPNSADSGPAWAGIGTHASGRFRILTGQHGPAAEQDAWREVRSCSGQIVGGSRGSRFLDYGDQSGRVGLQRLFFCVLTAMRLSEC